MPMRRHHYLITLHNLLQWHLHLLVKSSQDRLLCLSIKVFQRGSFIRIDTAFSVQELLRVRKPRRNRYGFNLNLLKASIGQQSAQFIGITEGKDCFYTRFAKSLQTQIMKRLIERMTVQALPGAEYRARA